MPTRESHSPEETMELARNIARDFQNHLVLVNGPMGAGKTLFSKGFAEGLGITQRVSSPTYTIMNEYRSNDKCLYHLDLYRINSLEEVIDTGLYEILESGLPCLVEWPERVEDLLKLPHLEVAISMNLAEDAEHRSITWNWVEV